VRSKSKNWKVLGAIKPKINMIEKGRVVYVAGHKAKRLVLQCINGVSSNPDERRKNFDSSKIEF
jgi:predicted GNAT family acetyltransferase